MQLRSKWRPTQEKEAAVRKTEKDPEQHYSLGNAPQE
jgi:hypothetical protein